MRSRGVVLILLSILAIADSEISRARVTFPFSEVIPSESFGPGFECTEECAVYATKETTLYRNQNAIANINVSTIDMSAPNVAYSNGSYTMSNARSYSNEGNFLIYVVKRSAPNFGTPVFVLQNNGLVVNTTNRYFTVLSNTNAMELSSFTGHFPTGYPKVYAAGFDAVSDLYGGTSCTPVYQARSYSNAVRSNPVVFAPIVTVDVGNYGMHSVSVKQPGNGYRGQKKAAGASAVYMSPGYIGCPFVGNQNYEDDNNNGERTVRDSFTLIATSLAISVSYNDVRKVKFRVNQDILDFNSTGPANFSRRYGPGALKVELDWRSYTSPTTSWAMQLDFGSEQTIWRNDFNINETSSPTPPYRVSPWQFMDGPRRNVQPSSPKYAASTKAPWPVYDLKNDTESDQSDQRWARFDPYQNATQSETLEWIADPVRLMHLGFILVLVAIVLICVYRRRRAARNFEPLTEDK